MLRSLRKKEYNQVKIDISVFSFTAVSTIAYGLPVYVASVPELNTVHKFLRRCHKRRYISYAIRFAWKNRRVNLQED